MKTKSKAKPQKRAGAYPLQFLIDFCAQHRGAKVRIQKKVEEITGETYHHSFATRYLTPSPKGKVRVPNIVLGNQIIEAGKLVIAEIEAEEKKAKAAESK